MRISRNEMTTALARAYEGAGYYIGDYEDASQIITWSQMCGLGGMNIIELPPLSPKGSATPRLIFETKGMAVIDAGGADVCEHGSLSAHLAYTKAQKSGLAIVQLTNCRYPIFILRCLSLIAQKGVYISSYWQGGTELFGASFESGAVFPSVWKAETKDSTPCSDLSDITIICTKQAAFLADAVVYQIEHPEIKSEEYSARQLAANYEQNLEKGILVEKEHWDALNASAWPILVAASEQSRDGAGPS